MNPFARLKFAKSLLLTLSAGVCLMASADGGTSRMVMQMTPHDRLYSVVFNGDFGEAVGEGGLVLTTTDGGKTWTRETVHPTELAMISVAIGGARSIAVGQQGLILVRDERKAWRKIEPVTDHRLLRVSVNKGGLAIAAGAFGTLLKSTDGGESWTDLKPDWATLYKTDNLGGFEAARDEPTLYAAKVFDDGSMLIGGEYGQINRSTDGGKTWTAVLHASSAVKGAVPPTIFGMQIRDDGTGYAAGQDGLILMTTDGGKSWTQLESSSKGSLFDIDSTADGHVVAVGMRTGLSSKDAGKTWQPLKVLDLSLNWYSGLGRSASATGDSMIAVGHSGRVLELAVGGS